MLSHQRCCKGSLCKLGQGHDIKMVLICKMVNLLVPVKAADTFIEFVSGDHGHKLSRGSLPVIDGHGRYDLAVNVNFRSFETATLFSRK